MMRRAGQIIVAVLLASAAGRVDARGNLKELTVPLKFTPQEGVHATSPDLPVALLNQAVDVRVEDMRKLDDPLTIGQGTGGNDKQFPIHADRDLVGFIREAVDRMNKDWSVKQSSPAGRTLIVQVIRYAIDESNKAVGSVYGSEVKLGFVMRDSRGKTLTEGSVSGTAHRYGRAHSPDNINEVLSDALKEAYANVLADTSLQNAWISGSPQSASNGAAPAEHKESPEERLRKLDDLFKKGLITKPEYDKKRAEILKEL